MSTKFARETAEVARAVEEIRGSLGRLAQRGKLPPCLMLLCTMIDRTEVGLTSEPGESAFVLDEVNDTIYFRTATLTRILGLAEDQAVEAGIVDPEEKARARQVAVNLFVLHELMHVQQHFPAFGTVARIKAGVAGLGLPILDLGADTAAAWVCAHIEADKLESDDADEFLWLYVNCLIMAYLLGAFVFTVIGRPPKMQRALGLLLSAVLVQAKVQGVLVEERLYANWQPASPLLAFDLEAAEAFNAIVIDSIPGLLIADADSLAADLQALWRGIGVAPVQETLQLVAEAFIRAGVIRPPEAARDRGQSLLGKTVRR